MPVPNATNTEDITLLASANPPRSNQRKKPWNCSRTFREILRLAIGVSAVGSLFALGNLARRKRVRAWNQLCLIASRNQNYYERWISVAEPPRLKTATGGPSMEAVATPLCLILNCSEASDALERTLASLVAAFGADVKVWADGKYLSTSQTPVIVPSLAPTLSTVLAEAESDTWLLPVRAGDIISPACGKALTHTVRKIPDCDIVYWDTDDITNGERSNPWIKGDWDPLMYLARDTLSRSCALRVTAALEAVEIFKGERLIFDDADFITIPALVMEIVKARKSDPVHIPLILSHCVSDGEPMRDWPVLISERWPDPVHIISRHDQPFLSIIPPMPLIWPSVSIIIPTRDKPHLLQACIDGLCKLQYDGQYEIIIVDNGTADPHALELLRTINKINNVRVVRDDKPFNFSALNNRAVEYACGDVLCLLNNDVEALDGEWLAHMVRHAAQPQIGAVGALLLYPNGSVQHAGVAIGTGGAAGHLAKGAAPNDPKHFAWHGVTRTVSAVTAACLVVRREVYEQVGGLDDLAFPVAFNDVDFCLRIRDQGFRNVFVAEAVLIHHESVSRGKDHTPAKAQRFSCELECLRERWGSADYRDPYYSALFSRSAEPCILAF